MCRIPLWPWLAIAWRWWSVVLIVVTSLLAQNPHGGGGVLASVAQSSGSRTNDGSGGGSVASPAAADGIPAVATGPSGTGSYSSYSSLPASSKASVEAIEDSLQTIHDIATENLGTLCLTKQFRPLRITLNPERYGGARQKADLAAVVLQDVGVARHTGLLDALAKGLLSDQHVTSARILSINMSDGMVANSVWWNKPATGMAGPIRTEEDGIAIGKSPDPSYPWFEDESSSPGLRSPKFAPSPLNISYRGWWTYPYYSCTHKRWILSYSVAIPPMGRHGLRGFLSIDIDISDLQVNQCDNANKLEIMSYNYHLRQYYPFVRNIKLSEEDEQLNQIEAFHGSHKCHVHSMRCVYRPVSITAAAINLNYNHYSNTSSYTNATGGSGAAMISKSLRIIQGWTRGAYECKCRDGFYSLPHPQGFNGSIMEVAFQEYRDNISSYYMDVFVCVRCAPGCATCTGPEPCLASYNWVFRTTLLTFSVMCAGFTVVLVLYMYQHRKVKVFKVASPIFLTITLLGCAFMYLEMAAIFPILDTYSCIATKWTRHMGFCVTYTALLMKTWRVSLTYRVKSAHKVKLTDKQLLQWMVPILLVMLIYLGTWTLSAPPAAEKIVDQNGLIFKQCSYNWWDHSLAIGEVLFLAWGIRVCYNVRNAESLYNEARLISYAIYNIALVNTTMVAFHLFFFPQAGPDIKYLLGFLRTQLSTSVTIALVFGPKVLRILRGQGDQWDQRARKRGITASFSLNGIGLVPEETADLYQENEELKEEIQKLAAQIEFMKIVHMEMNNRHLKPKPGSYFTLKSPLGKSIGAGGLHSSHRYKHPPKEDSLKENSAVITEDGHSGGTNSCYSGTANSIGDHHLNKVCCYAHPDAPLIEDYRAGDMICSECGLVVGDRVIDVGSEWRTFSNEKAGVDPSRVGGPENPLLSGGDLSTMIGPGTGPASFDAFGTAKYQNRRTMSSSDRALIAAFKEISTMADRINLPKTIVDRANNLFKQVHDGKNLKGRSNDAKASACLYIACRQEGVPRTFKEICAVSKISKKEIGRCFKLTLKALATSVDLITTADFMSRFCANLDLPNTVQRAATHIARKAVEMDIVPGRSPISVAAAAIYMASQASDQKKTHKEIGDIAGVADVTIRQSYRLMYPHAAELFPEDFKFTTPIDQLPQM